MSATGGKWFSQGKIRLESKERARSKRAGNVAYLSKTALPHSGKDCLRLYRRTLEIHGISMIFLRRYF